MTSYRRKEEILSSLDSILAGIKWKGPPSDTSHLANPVHLASFKTLGNHEEVTSARIIAAALQHAKGVNTTLRVCSFGCEDGALDRIILEGLRDIKVEYLGMEADEQMCEAAMDKLADISPNIKVSTKVVDYEELDEEEVKSLTIEPFDLIWMVNCTYYASSLTPLIHGAIQLLKPSGKMLIISSSMQSFEQLITRFWSHQRNHHLHTSESVIGELTNLQLTHHISREPVTFNLTQQFRDEFKSPASGTVLDHLVYCRLSDYPSEVTALVTEFLQAIAQTNSTGIIISSMSDMITVIGNH